MICGRTVFYSCKSINCIVSFSPHKFGRILKHRKTEYVKSEIIATRNPPFDYESYQPHILSWTQNTHA